jgi:protein Mpv17
MASFGLGARLPGGGSGFGRPQRHGQQRQHRHRARSSSGAAAGSAPQQQGLLDNPWLKSGLISGSLSLAGDVLAQLLTLRGQQQQGSSSGGYDVARAARMGTFGLLFYGPYQYWWYGLLARTFPGTSIPMFATKVALNQLCLAPITISVVFSWNMALAGQLDQLPDKFRRDFLRTMVNGWRFWVPAATINFKLVPLQYQVLYMSTCGMLWTAYLSYQSAAQAK